MWHRKFGVIDNYHGPAGSPVLYKDRVFIYQDANPAPGQRAFVGAFDKKTGKTIWETPRSETVGWGTAVVIHTGERDELVVSSQRRVAAYDPDSGKELWTVRGMTFEVIPTPVVGHGLVFASSGRAGPTMAIRPGGSGDVTATHVAWNSPKGSPFVPSGIVVDDLLYLINDMQSILTVYEAATGTLVYQERLGVAQREGFSASPVHVNGKIYFTNDDGADVRGAGRPQVQPAAHQRTGCANTGLAGVGGWHVVLAHGPGAGGDSIETSGRAVRVARGGRRRHRRH